MYINMRTCVLYSFVSSPSHFLIFSPSRFLASPHTSSRLVSISQTTRSNRKIHICELGSPMGIILHKDLKSLLEKSYILLFSNIFL